MNMPTQTTEARRKLAIAGWSQALTADRVLTDQEALAPYSRNVTALERSIVAVLKPRSTDEVVAVLKVMGEFFTQRNVRSDAAIQKIERPCCQ